MSPALRCSRGRRCCRQLPAPSPFLDRRWRESAKKPSKKSTLVALLVFLSAVAGALAAAYFYLVKREKELDEYEQMLFSEDYDDEDGCAGCEAGAAPEQNASEE